MKWKNIYPLLVLHLGVAPWSFMEMQYPWLNLVHYIRFVENYLGLFGVNQTLVGWLKINVTSCSLIFTNSEKSFQNEGVSRQKNRFLKKKVFYYLQDLLLNLFFSTHNLAMSDGSLRHSNQGFCKVQGCISSGEVQGCFSLFVGVRGVYLEKGGGGWYPIKFQKNFPKKKKNHNNK